VIGVFSSGEPLLIEADESYLCLELTVRTGTL